MLHKLRILFIVLFLLNSGTIISQEKMRNWTLNGHLQYLENVWIPPETKQWQTLGQINNRLDFRWYPADFLSFHFGARNIMNYGTIIQDAYPYYAELAAFEPGFLDLTELWVNDSSYFIYSTFDRAMVKFTLKNFEATVGRQRINWGINMVWTPNDIFNTFNYFDFNYIERPGCDAVLLQYYTGATSSLQFAFKMDYQDDITSALMYKFNRWNYDFQFFAGVMEKDYVAGAGWSGQIKGAGFTGEATYFIDSKRFADTNGVVVGSVGINYTFSNSIYVSGSYLFNSAGTTGKAGWGTALTLYLDINAKTFTLAKHSVFAQISYPITPLIKIDGSAIFNPNDKSGYFGPSLDISLTDNISVFLISQIFWGDNGSEFGDYGSFNYLRLSWNF
jgi:hypothetical protein